MKFYSEKLKKLFDTPEDLTNAEVAAEKAELEKKNLETKKANERKAHAAEVKTAREEMLKAIEKYRKRLNDFCQTYGRYHHSITNSELNDLDNKLEGLWWNIFTNW